MLSPPFPAPAPQSPEELVSSQIASIFCFTPPFYASGSETDQELAKPVLLVLPKLMLGVYIFILSESCICLFGTKHEFMDSCRRGELFKESLMFDHQA